MSKLPIESIEKREVIFEIPRNRHTIFQGLCNRTGSTVSGKIRELMYKYMEESLEKDLSTNGFGFTAAEIAIDIWSPDPTMEKGQPSIRPTCVLCGKVQSFKDPSSKEPAEDGYVHYWMPNRSETKCYCLQCLCALAIKNTSATTIKHEELQAAYSLNIGFILNPHSPVGKTLFGRLMAAKSAFFQNVPELNDCTDDEVLSCYKDVSKRGLLESSKFYKRFGNESSGIYDNTANVKDYETGQYFKPSDMMFIRFKGQTLFGFKRSRLVENGREILADPLRAAMPTRLAHGLQFDASDLAMAKRCPMLDQNSFRDRVRPQTVRTPYEAPQPVSQRSEPTVATGTAAPFDFGVFWQNGNGKIVKKLFCPENTSSETWLKYEGSPENLRINDTGDSFRVRHPTPDLHSLEINPGDWYDDTLQKF